MVNQTVLEYLRVNKGNYKLADLKKKIIGSGYSNQDVNEALLALNKQTSGSAPSVKKTIKQLNKTNISDVKPKTKFLTSIFGLKPKTKPQKIVNAQKPGVPVKEPAISVKKSKKKLIIILGAILLVLILGGIASWWLFIE